MHLKRFFGASVLALGALCASSSTLAQDCVGFTDVPAASGFCPNVEWLKNRLITTGCTSATLYCPNDPVTRLAMSAFLNRLGTALTPVFLRRRQQSSELGALNYSTTPQTVCVTGPFAVTGYPRSAIITPLLNLFTPDGGMDIEARIVYSVEPNPNVWLTVPTGEGFAYGSLYNIFSPPHDISLRPYASMDLNVGTTYRFAVQGVRAAGSGANANTYCENHVQIVNRNGGTSPFDEPPPSGPPGR